MKSLKILTPYEYAKGLCEYRKDIENTLEKDASIVSLENWLEENGLDNVWNYKLEEIDECIYDYFNEITTTTTYLVADQYRNIKLFDNWENVI